MTPLYFKIEPIDRPPAKGNTYVVVQPEHHERDVHNAHPDRQVADSVAGDVLVIDRRRKYRMVAVQRFGEWNGEWFDNVPVCLEWIAEQKRQNEEFHRRWWAEHSRAI